MTQTRNRPTWWLATLAIWLVLATSCTVQTTVGSAAPIPALAEPTALVPVSPTAEPAPTPVPTPTPEPLQEVSFRQSGGLLKCADGESRMGSMFWTDEQDADTDPGGFFGYSDTEHLGTFRMSPIAEQPLDGTNAAVEVTPGFPLLPATINAGSLDCTFENNEYTSYSIYDGDFECTEIDADTSFILKEQAPGDKMFLAWQPSNAPGYVMSILTEGQGTFRARGIDDGSIFETVIVDFAFDQELVAGRSHLTMSGELLYQDDPVPQSCGGEWDARTLPAGMTDEAPTDVETNRSAPAGNLRYVHDSATQVWAEDIVVFDNGNAYPIPPDYVAIEHGDATDRNHITVEMQWKTDDGHDISVHFYTRHDGEQWWSYEVRTKVDYPDEDGDWVYYPGDNDTFYWDREHGAFFRSPLGTSYQGDVILDTLVVKGLRFEAFGAEFPIDEANDLGPRPPRPDYLIQTTPYRFETNFALLDAESVHVIIDGERTAPTGEIRVSAPDSYVGDSGSQEIEINWRDPADESGHQLMLYFRTNGSDSWIHRIRTSHDGVRVDLGDLVVAQTPLGSVFEGDIVTENVELLGVRLELVGCQGRPGLQRFRCPLDD